ncbi:MAG: tolB protein precursor, periplasmic protein involved in the tonb-independent uptake of group A colicins [uncultured Campylobacterales bacterium]|uniref:TolB protein, periplasmic protein involved in the tonb-independent uptake of group A colicins n=1 Tax=uncultured Campylobacterales bacterium TaxID=352960 RepID=A0A6S6SDQ0_9BACT|nr:MAG: tolB protein precursor, periplasmic protein involved in the tonb-independent uptake of group A colicins [uncultured Campylobacterales bacterium]
MIKKIISFLVVINFVFAYDATLEIVKKIDKKTKIKIINKSELENKTVEKIDKLLIGDFAVSSHFEPIKSINNDLKEIDYLLEYKVYLENSILICDISLVKNDMEVVLQKTYKTSNIKKYPFLIHKIVSDINDFLGYDSIGFINRYVIFSKYTKGKGADIIISDYTLTYSQTLVKNGGLNIFPKWASSEQDAFYYTSYIDDRPTLIKYELKTGKRTKIMASDGMIICSDVSSDGKKLLLSMAPDDQPDIYMYDIETKMNTKITTHRGTDVSGHFIDNDRIVFVSDLLGYPNIFSIKQDGEELEQMVHHSRNNSSCDSFKNYIVYASRDKYSEFGANTFNLYMISTNTDFIRPLTTVGQNMYPRFSYTGTHILHIKHLKNQSALMIIDIATNRSFMFPLSVGKLQSIDW